MIKIQDKYPFLGWLLIILVIATLSALYSKSIFDLFWQWDNREEYSHGYLIPVVVVYFMWQQKTQLQYATFSASWLGFLAVLVAALLYMVGAASVLYVLMQYALVLMLIGLLWALIGNQAIKIIILPLLMLFFAIPLPEYLDVLLSSKLQLLSSSLGVWLIQWCKIPVYQDGNLIDLGVYKLQVVEACSGLRYLFPLLSIGFMCVYMFKAALWKRVLVFFSCIPITILMNSFRIGMIGILVDGWGIAMAEGFVHDFEGWIVYMTCLGILILEMMLFNAATRPRRAFSEVFTAFADEPATHIKNRTPPLYTAFFTAPFLCSLAVMVMLTLFTLVQRQDTEIIPQRQTFKSFPLRLGDWQGKNALLPADQLNVLKLTDYVLNDYRQQDNKIVNFYVAYYESQKRRAAPHSPRVCIPGGGWEITDIARIEVEGHPINRLMIKKGLQRQLVYYWYQQRGTIVANEFAMKWHLFKDALLLNRTDGALVRLTTSITAEETEIAAEQRLHNLLQAIEPVLNNYIPK
ncbi:MAG: VPLPA-CTERM-specific exosortase XrtD [Methylococcaceae bacterium]|nr:VPLPA-CTERM-specific exosortase XrtD [Methylococcaceae bacterium]